MKNTGLFIYVSAITLCFAMFLALVSSIPDFLKEARDAGFGHEYKIGLFVILIMNAVPLFSGVWFLVSVVRGERFLTSFYSLIKVIAILLVASFIVGNVVKFALRSIS